MNGRNSIRWYTGGLAILLGALWGCESAVPIANTPPPPVTVSQPVVREITDFDDYEGRIAAVDTNEVRARVRGHLTKVNFQAGQIVKAGDLLYEIDPRPYQAVLDSAKAQEKSADASLALAKAEYNRTRQLVSQNAASRQDLDVWTAKQTVASADLLKAQAAVAEAQLDLDFTKITAPFSGKISRTQVDPGNLVNAGGGETLLTTIASVDPMYVYFDVDERALLRYRKDPRYAKPGTDESRMPIKDLKIPVYVGLEGEEGYPHHGMIDFADNKVNPSTGTIQVRGVIPNPKGLLEAGMRARVRIPVSDPHKVLMVTERAVANDQGQKLLYLVNAQNVVERRDVKLGRVEDTLQVIREGLSPEDWVIVNGIQRVREEMKVEPERRPMPGAPAAASGEAKPTGTKQ
jgi:RND family efflux transporter MFP subunit